MKLVRVRKSLDKIRGQSMVEYALIIGLIAVALIVALTALSGGISNLFNEVINAF
jgi:Flp pilus assembly pilin Flp